MVRGARQRIATTTTTATAAATRDNTLSVQLSLPSPTLLRPPGVLLAAAAAFKYFGLGGGKNVELPLRDPVTESKLS